MVETDEALSYPESILCAMLGGGRGGEKSPLLLLVLSAGVEIPVPVPRHQNSSSLSPPVLLLLK